MSDCYNVKLTEYKHSSQIKMYSRPIQTGKHRVRRKNERQSSIERTQKQIEHSYQSSINRTKANIYSYALSNDWEYFCTFTFNPKFVLSSDYEECVQAFSSWLQNVHKRRCPNMKYLVVPEYHKDKHKFHFHALMSNISELTFVDSGRSKNERAIYNIYEYKLGFSTAVKLDSAEESQAKVCNYMLKYITKDLVSLSKGKKRYWVSKSTIEKADVTTYALTSEDFDDFRRQALINCGYTKTIEIDCTDNIINIFSV